MQSQWDGLCVSNEDCKIFPFCFVLQVPVLHSLICTYQIMILKKCSYTKFRLEDQLVFPCFACLSDAPFLNRIPPKRGTEVTFGSGQLYGRCMGNNFEAILERIVALKCKI